ncbi:hypothetical protein B0H13DRAFT_2477918 [Mycena leptocephala]|nr:hypothetical protein B0H13DRAFT_2477918 [Mycena leptocephala]
MSSSSFVPTTSLRTPSTPPRVSLPLLKYLPGAAAREQYLDVVSGILSARRAGHGRRRWDVRCRGGKIQSNLAVSVYRDREGGEVDCRRAESYSLHCHLHNGDNLPILGPRHPSSLPLRRPHATVAAHPANSRRAADPQKDVTTHDRGSMRLSRWVGNSGPFVALLCTPLFLFHSRHSLPLFHCTQLPSIPHRLPLPAALVNCPPLVLVNCTPPCAVTLPVTPVF